MSVFRKKPLVERIESKKEARDQIAKDMEVFLANGGQVEKLSHAASAVPEFSKRLSKEAHIKRVKQIRHKRNKRQKDDHDSRY